MLKPNTFKNSIRLSTQVAILAVILVGCNKQAAPSGSDQANTGADASSFTAQSAADKAQAARDKDLDRQNQVTLAQLNLKSTQLQADAKNLLDQQNSANQVQIATIQANASTENAKTQASASNMGALYQALGGVAGPMIGGYMQGKAQKEAAAAQSEGNLAAIKAQGATEIEVAKIRAFAAQNDQQKSATLSNLQRAAATEKRTMTEAQDMINTMGRLEALKKDIASNQNNPEGLKAAQERLTKFTDKFPDAAVYASMTPDQLKKEKEKIANVQLEAAKSYDGLSKEASLLQPFSPQSDAVAAAEKRNAELKNKSQQSTNPTGQSLSSIAPEQQSALNDQTASVLSSLKKSVPMEDGKFNTDAMAEARKTQMATAFGVSSEDFDKAFNGRTPKEVSDSLGRVTAEIAESHSDGSSTSNMITAMIDSPNYRAPAGVPSGSGPNFSTPVNPIQVASNTGTKAVAPGGAVAKEPVTKNSIAADSVSQDPTQADIFLCETEGNCQDKTLNDLFAQIRTLSTAENPEETAAGLRSDVASRRNALGVKVGENSVASRTLDAMDNAINLAVNDPENFRSKYNDLQAYLADQRQAYGAKTAIAAVNGIGNLYTAENFKLGSSGVDLAASYNAGAGASGGSISNATCFYNPSDCT